MKNIFCRLEGWGDRERERERERVQSLQGTASYHNQSAPVNSYQLMLNLVTGIKEWCHSNVVMRLLTTSHLTPQQTRARQYFVFPLCGPVDCGATELSFPAGMLSWVLASQLVARAVGRFGLTWDLTLGCAETGSASVRVGQWGEVRWY